jgi:hypothetical protein
MLVFLTVNRSSLNKAQGPKGPLLRDVAEALGRLRPTQAERRGRDVPHAGP